MGGASRKSGTYNPAWSRSLPIASTEAGAKNDARTRPIRQARRSATTSWLETSRTVVHDRIAALPVCRPCPWACLLGAIQPSALAACLMHDPCSHDNDGRCHPRCGRCCGWCMGMDPGSNRKERVADYQSHHDGKSCLLMHRTVCAEVLTTVDRNAQSDDSPCDETPGCPHLLTATPNARARQHTEHAHPFLSRLASTAKNNLALGEGTPIRQANDTHTTCMQQIAA